MTITPVKYRAKVNINRRTQPVNGIIVPPSIKAGTTFDVIAETRTDSDLPPFWARLVDHDLYVCLTDPQGQSLAVKV